MASGGLWGPLRRAVRPFWRAVGVVAADVGAVTAGVGVRYGRLWGALRRAVRPFCRDALLLRLAGIFCTILPKVQHSPPHSGQSPALLHKRQDFSTSRRFGGTVPVFRATIPLTPRYLRIQVAISTAFCLYTANLRTYKLNLIKLENIPKGKSDTRRNLEM